MFVALYFALMHLAQKNTAFSRLAKGRPVLLIKDGRICWSALSGAKLTEADLQETLRLQGLMQSQRVKKSLPRAQRRDQHHQERCRIGLDGAGRVLRPHPAPGLSPSPQCKHSARIQDATRRILSEWELAPQAAARILGVAVGEYGRWRVGKDGGSPPPLDRQAALIEIDRALKVLFPNTEQGVTWLRRPRAAFEHRSALEAMLDGEDGLERVRAILVSRAASAAPDCGGQ